MIAFPIISHFSRRVSSQILALMAVLNLGDNHEMPCILSNPAVSQKLATPILVIVDFCEIFWIDSSQYCIYPSYISASAQGYRVGLLQPSGLQRLQARQ